MTPTPASRFDAAGRLSSIACACAGSSSWITVSRLPCRCRAAPSAPGDTCAKSTRPRIGESLHPFCVSASAAWSWRRTSRHPANRAACAICRARKSASRRRRSKYCVPTFGLAGRCAVVLSTVSGVCATSCRSENSPMGAPRRGLEPRLVWPSVRCRRPKFHPMIPSLPATEIYCAISNVICTLPETRCQPGRFRFEK